MNLDFPDYQQHVSVIDPGDSKLGLIKKLSTEDTVLYPNNPLVKLRHPITNGDRPKRNGETHLFINRAKIIMIIPALIKASVRRLNRNAFETWRHPCNNSFLSYLRSMHGFCKYIF